MKEVDYCTQEVLMKEVDYCIKEVLTKEVDYSTQEVLMTGPLVPFLRISSKLLVCCDAQRVFFTVTYTDITKTLTGTMKEYLPKLPE